MIVALVGDKGGTGRTTLATNLAAMRVGAGHGVLLIDADRQGSSSFWRENLGRGSHFLWSENRRGGALETRLVEVPQVHEDTIVDTGAGDDREISAVLAVADCVIAPLQPSGVDVWMMGFTDRRVAEAQERNPGLRAWALLNRVVTGEGSDSEETSSTEEEAREALSSCVALRVADITVRNDVAFKRALNEGVAVDQLQVDSQDARDDMAAVYRLVFEEEYRRQFL